MSKAAIKSGSKWYIIRAVPGSQRQAKAYDGLSRKRAGESILERECRNRGIDIYMPSFWLLAQHQRTNKLIDKRLPLLVGYAFVRIDDGNFAKVDKVPSVMCILKHGKTGDVVTMQDEDVGQLMLADHLRAMEYARLREERAEKGRMHRRNQLNRRLGQILPKGRNRKIPVRMRAEAEIDKLPPAVRERVLHIIQEIRAIENEGETCAPHEFGLNLVA